MFGEIFSGNTCLPWKRLVWDSLAFGLVLGRGNGGEITSMCSGHDCQLEMKSRWPMIPNLVLERVVVPSLNNLRDPSNLPPPSRKVGSDAGKKEPRPCQPVAPASVDPRLSRPHTEELLSKTYPATLVSHIKLAENCTGIPSYLGMETNIPWPEVQAVLADVTR